MCGSILTACIVLYNSDISVTSQTIDTYLSTDIPKYLILFDNASKNDILSRLRQKYAGNSNIFFLASEKNIGFGAGHNVAFARICHILDIGDNSRHYHLILNPDVIIHDKCLEKMIHHLEANHNIGLLVPKILNQDGSIQKLNKRYPTIFDLFVRRFVPKFMSKWRFFRDRDDYYTMTSMNYDTIHHLEFASGCFMLFGADIFRKLGGFDERFFLYMEDADISLRANHLSEVVFYPDSVITHLWARESHKSLYMTMIAIKSAILYFNKHGWKWI